MDSLIHYDSSDGLNVLSSYPKIKEGGFYLAPVLFSGSMHTIGLFFQGDRAFDRTDSRNKL